MSLLTYLRYMNPFTVLREYIRKPIESYVLNQYLGYKKQTGRGITSIKEVVYKVAVVIVFLSAILWISIFLYVGFYNIYMPNVTHVRPVHFQFKPCEDKMGICSYPYAYIQLTRQSYILMPKQRYKVRLILEMPESQFNKDLGMFMVCVQMRAKGGFLVSSSCRAAMLQYRSKLHYILRTFVMAPLFLGGVEDESQQLKVELFSDFEDDPEKPATDAYVELQTRYAQVYSSELHVQAHFSGLRYVMYHWPKISAVIGICTNLFFVTLLFVLSWYHLQEGLPDYVKSKFTRPEVKTEPEDSKPVGKVKLEREDSSSMFEEDVLLKEFQQIEEKETKKT